MRMSLQGANAGLLRAVRAMITEHPELERWAADAPRPSLVVESFESSPWASLTFSGMRHQMEFRIEGVESSVARVRTMLCERLDEPDLALPGHFIADTELSDVGCHFREDGTMSLCLRLQTLTIEE